jgi:hypothetical protein
MKDSSRRMEGRRMTVRYGRDGRDEEREHDDEKDVYEGEDVEECEG